MKKYAIIVAGGKGVRMGSAVPKQFLEVNGLPLMMHTIKLFLCNDPKTEVILVLPQPYFAAWKDLCKLHLFNSEHLLAEGGPARFHSVKSGLKYVPDKDSLVAIHDAVRPLVSLQVIAKVYYDAEIYGNAIPVVPINESVRERRGSNNLPLDRSKLFIVQTPQCFRASEIKKAYQQSYCEEFTDDASVLEYEGATIHLVEGNPENIKVTTKTDLLFAETLLKEAKNSID